MCVCVRVHACVLMKDNKEGLSVKENGGWGSKGWDRLGWIGDGTSGTACMRETCVCVCKGSACIHLGINF